MKRESSAQFDSPSVRLEDTPGGTTVFAGRYLYSRRNPRRRPESLALSAEIEPRCLYMVPSPLLGYGLQTLIERLPGDSHILAFEARQDLFALCSNRIPRELASHPRVTWVRLSETPALHALLRRLGLWRFRRVRRVDLSAGASLDTELYERLIVFVENDLAAYWRNRHALGQMGRQWVRHILANLTALAAGSYKIAGPMEAQGLPVIVGAGPSLEAALPALKENRERLWILAVDTAAGALMASGIQPDAVVLLETQAWNHLDFHGLARSGLPILADLTAYPPSLDQTGGPCRFFTSSFADLDFLDRLETAGLKIHPIPPLGSVGLAAVELALSLSQKPVILTGLDFAYGHGKSHARGTSVHQWQLSMSCRLNPNPGGELAMNRRQIRATGARGGTVRTDAVLAGYAALLRDRYARLGRLHILEPGGMDLGLPLINRQVLKQMSLVKTEEVPPPPAHIAPRAAEVFLRDERQRLERAVKKWDNYAQNEGSAEEVAESLKGLDQIFCDFPDPPPLPVARDAFLVRAIRRARTLIHYMDRLGEESV